jgi:dTDP-4-amino-4,6-dideoxygalactose transaminase
VAGVIAHGLIPVFPDVDLRTGAITAETIAPKITARTRAIIAVHFYGLVCDMDPICELAKAHNLFLIEDVCQAPLATYKGRTVGSLADAACWSMDTEKHLSAAGGGAITTSRKDFADACRKYAWTRGSLPIPGYQGRLHDQFGLNYRCSNLNAGVALANLAILPDQNRKRAKMADRLTAQLRGVPGVQPPFIPEGCSHIYWVYHMLLDPTAFRAPLAEVVEAVNAEGLLSGMPMYYLIPEYITFIRDRAHAFGKSEFPFCFRPREEWPAYGADSVPKAKEHLTRTLQFPWTDKYEEPDVDDVAAIVRKVAGHYCR